MSKINKFDLDKWVNKSIELNSRKKAYCFYSIESSNSVCYRYFSKNIRNSEIWKKHETSERIKRNIEFSEKIDYWVDICIEFNGIKNGYNELKTSIDTSYTSFCNKVNKSPKWIEYLNNDYEKQILLVNKMIIKAKEFICFKKAYYFYKDEVRYSYNYYLKLARKNNEYTNWYRNLLKNGVDIILNSIDTIPNAKKIHRDNKLPLSYVTYMNAIKEKPSFYRMYKNGIVAFYNGRLDYMMQMYHNNVDMSDIANKVGLSERKTIELIHSEFKSK